MRTACADHVFKLGRAFRVGHGSGWSQAAKCMVCGDVTSPMDISWFERAEAEDISACVAFMKSERERLASAILRLQIVGASVE
jgi:hypothetical protein